MVETAPLTPHAWEAFYVIVGSTAGALIGLQFVVLTLIAEGGRVRGTSETRGHGTHTWARFWRQELIDLLARTE